MKAKRRDRKYFAPQDGGNYHKCDHPDCNERGEFRAPKDKNLKEYYWFCLKHVQEYNARWDYYANGRDDEEETEKMRRKFSRFSSKIKYQFGFDFEEEFAHNGYNFENFTYADIYFDSRERGYLKIMEISPESPISVDDIKKQYKKLVKKYHPDLNNNDKQKEEKFKELNNAYSELMKKFS